MGRNTSIFVGFALFVLTLVLGYYSSAGLVALTPITQSERVSFHLLVSGAEVVALLVLALAFRHSDRRFFGHPVRVALISAALGILSFALLMVPRSVSNAAPSLIGAAFAFGCALALLLVFWYSQLACFSYRGSYLLIIAAHGMATLVDAGLVVMPFDPTGITSLVALLLSCLCVALQRSGQQTPPSDGQQTPPSDGRQAPPSDGSSRPTPVREALPLVRTGVIAVCVFAFVSGLIQRSSGGAVSNPSELQGFMLSASAIVLVVMLIPVLVTRKPLKLENSYRIALPLSTLGFIVVPFLVSDLSMGVSGILVTTGYMLTGIVLYCTIAEAARVTGAPILPLLAGCEVLSLGCYLAGALASYPLSEFVSGTWGGMAIIGLALLSLTLFLLMSFSQKGRKPEFSTGFPVAAGEAISLGSLEESGGFNERELDIVTLLLQGRTLSRIGEELGLSTSGIKYHAHSLYRKLGVRSRDELLSLFKDSGVVPGEMQNGGEQLTVGEQLTAREREVALLLVRGLTLDAIATELVISPNTIKSHVRTIYSKLGVHSRQELMDLEHLKPNALK
ncbi:MAG: helix-turn-helix transcriptional regulator [Coriobacteriales bacterium]|jgi:DNA-binding NarL/FixJ family response regulator|nr:helix-turn-helix transcriptional regulator [Coriobacteriales bacterium]